MTDPRSRRPSRSRASTNPRVKAAVRLRDRREREATGLTIVDGAREILRALDAGVRVETAFVAPDLLRTPDAHGRRRATPPPAVDDRGQPGRPRQGRVRRALGRDRRDRRARRTRRSTTSRCPDDPLVVVVEGVEKPGNLGAVLRTADGAGADAVIAADPRTDLFNPNAIRASLGTIFARPGRRRRPSDDVARLADAPRDPAGRGDRRRPDRLHRRRPARSARDRARQRGRRPVGGLARPRVDAGRDPDARHRRQPERLDRRRGRCSTRRVRQRGGHAPSRGTLTPMETFDFVIIGAGPAGEAAAYKARARGATVAVIDRRWFGGSCPHIGCLPSKSLLHAAAEHAAQPGRVLLGAGVGGPRLHGQPAGGRRGAGRLLARRAARGRRRGLLPRHRPDRRPRPGRDPPRRRASTRSAAGTSSSRSARVSKVPPLPGLDGVRIWTNREATLARELPREPRSSSAAARPAASWPRSTPGSASR